MLETLERLGNITVGEYERDIKSRHITLKNWNIGFRMTNNVKFKELHNKDPYYGNKNQILEECYRRGRVVVNIHDALVVLNVKANETVTSSDAVRVIENVYNAHGLYPTISVEEYGRDMDAP